MTIDEFPTEDLLDALAEAALNNSDRLVRDATTLLDAGSPGTAYSIAILALEEVGKGVQCKRLAGDDETQDRAKFKRDFMNHAAKLQRVINLLDIISAVYESAAAGRPMGMGDNLDAYKQKLIKAGKARNAAKQSGFYVELSDDDEIRLPNAITADDAKRAIELAVFAAHLYRGLFRGGLQFELPPRPCN